MEYLCFYNIPVNGSKAGLTDAEPLGIQKVDDYLALNKVDYGDILEIRNFENIKGGSYSGEDWYNYFVNTYGKDNVQGTFLTK